MKTLQTTLTRSVMIRNCVSEETSQLVTKTEWRSPMMCIVCLSLSSFSSTMLLVRSDTGQSWHMVRMIGSRNCTAKKKTF